jgi:hypothetical protein
MPVHAITAFPLQQAANEAFKMGLKESRIFRRLRDYPS